MRKSEPLPKPVNGNAVKFDRYREAWTRINDSTKSGYFIEATTLLEAVASDRLVSFLLHATDDDCRNNKHMNFYNLLKTVKSHACSCTKPDELRQVCDELQEWRQKRNEVVHGIVKSCPGNEQKSIDDFLRLACNCASEGQQLVKKLQKLTKRKMPEKQPE